MGGLRQAEHLECDLAVACLVVDRRPEIEAGGLRLPDREIQVFDLVRTQRADRVAQVVAEAVQRRDAVIRVDGDRHPRVRGRAGLDDVVDLGLDGKGSVRQVVFGRTVSGLFRIEDKRGRRGDVDRHPFAWGHCRVAENTVIGRNRRTRISGGRLAHVVIEGIGAVRGLVVEVIGIGEIEAGIWYEAETGGGQIVPVTERDLVRLGLGVVDRIRRDRRRVQVVVAKKVGRNVVGCADDRFTSHTPVRVGRVHHLIGGVVLIPQCGVQQHARPNTDRTAAAVDQAVRDIDHAVFAGAGVGQLNPLGKGQLANRPGCRNACGVLGGGQVIAAQAQKRIIAAENILLDLAGLVGHFERRERRVVPVAVEKQPLVVIGLVQQVAVNCPDGKAAVPGGDRDLDHAVVQQQDRFLGRTDPNVLEHRSRLTSQQEDGQQNRQQNGGQMVSHFHSPLPSLWFKVEIGQVTDPALRDQAEGIEPFFSQVEFETFDALSA